MNLFNFLKTETEVLANGTMADKRDIADPTAKFVGARYVKVRRTAQTSRKNSDFFKPEYDLLTIANATQMDGYLRRAVNLFKEQILKNGYELTSKNDKIVTHINRRIKEIERLTGVSFNETITTMVEQLVTYGNSYLVKVRSGVKSVYGKDYRLYGKSLKPIVGLFVAEATTIEIGLNSQNDVVQYKQIPRGNQHRGISVNEYSNYWDERDVIHFAYNKIPGTLTGQSAILPVLDDVRALRKLEEEIEILGFQYAIPLYLYKVGNKDIPPAPGEIEDTAARVNSMPPYGMLVVPGHHTIEVPTNTSTPVDIMEFVQHFKARIFSGLGVSPVAMGEVSTSNRNTSEVLDLTMQSITKSYQYILKNKIEMELIRELLLDGGFTNVDDNLEFNFPEIDLENQIKFETNVIQKWQNNMISREEARLEMDYDKKIKENETFLQLVDIPKINAEAKAQAAAGVTIEKSKPKPSGTVAAKSRPTNQHGTSSGRPKIKRDFVTLDDSFNLLFNNLLDDESYKSNLNRNLFADKIVKGFKTKIKLQFDDVLNAYNGYYNLDIESNNKIFNDYVDVASAVLDDKIKRFTKTLEDNIRCDIFKNEISTFYDYQKQKITNLVKILMYKSLGYKTILVSGDCLNHSKYNIDIKNINYANIPPVGKICTCDVEEDSFHEFN